MHSGAAGTKRVPDPNGGDSELQDLWSPEKPVDLLSLRSFLLGLKLSRFLLPVSSPHSLLMGSLLMYSVPLNGRLFCYMTY